MQKILSENRKKVTTVDMCTLFSLGSFSSLYSSAEVRVDKVEVGEMRDSVGGRSLTAYRRRFMPLCSACFRD